MAQIASECQEFCHENMLTNPCRPMRVVNVLCHTAIFLVSHQCPLVAIYRLEWETDAGGFLGPCWPLLERAWNVPDFLVGHFQLLIYFLGYHGMLSTSGFQRGLNIGNKDFPIEDIGELNV